jgi:DNA-binding GntR family transcriptional regulator
MIKTSEPANSKPSATQRAYQTLRREIITGRLPPGQRLKVDTLKESLGTGASPVREALSLLTSDQLVERLDQRGFRVAQTSAAQFQEILKLRCNLEGLAVRQSIENGDQTWEEDLVLSHYYLTRSDRTNAEAFEERHKEFHMALLAACGSPILVRFCDQLYDLNVRYRYLAGTSKSYSTRNVESEHEAILEAAVNRDSEKTAKLLIEHYLSTGAFLSELAA